MIKIKKGLDLPLTGAAGCRVSDARSIVSYAVKPTDYVGLVPRLMVVEGDEVSAGDVLFCDKNDERIRFVSPVGGVVKAVVRGEKRKLLAVVVKRQTGNGMSSPLSFDNVDDLKQKMLHSGLWTLLRQRPFGIVANPDTTPKAIVVSGFDSAPLGCDYDFALQGREDDLCRGLETLSMLTESTTYICFRPGQRLAQSVLSHCGKVNVQYVEGPHPAGNVGTQIAQLCPINKGESVWTMNIQDVAVLGHWVATGQYCPERVIAVAGPLAKNPHYYRIIAGACVEEIVRAQVLNVDYPALECSKESMQSIRVISGNVLSGTRIAQDGFVGAYDSLVSMIPEGDYYDFMGWLMPGLKKHSFSRTFASGFIPNCMSGLFKVLPEELQPRFDTNIHGGVRPLVFTGDFEKVFPFDIYPLQLLKACIVGDLELMEKLGIYEVEPEDFALCEYIDPSKTDIQPIIREALEKLRKEGM